MSLIYARLISHHTAWKQWVTISKSCSKTTWSEGLTKSKSSNKELQTNSLKLTRRKKWRNSCVISSRWQKRANIWWIHLKAVLNRLEFIRITQERLIWAHKVRLLIRPQKHLAKKIWTGKIKERFLRTLLKMIMHLVYSLTLFHQSTFKSLALQMEQLVWESQTVSSSKTCYKVIKTLTTITDSLLLVIPQPKFHRVEVAYKTNMAETVVHKRSIQHNISLLSKICRTKHLNCLLVLILKPIFNCKAKRTAFWKTICFQIRSCKIIQVKDPLKEELVLVIIKQKRSGKETLT